MSDALLANMDTLARWLVVHRQQLWLAWVVLLVVLAACTNPVDGGGGY